MATTPFENNLLLVSLNGSGIRAALENGVKDVNNLAVVQVSGIKVSYDLSHKINNRITEIKVLCQKCEIPRYEPLEDSKIYKVVMTDYVYTGGADFSMFPDAIIPDSTIKGPRDIDALSEYVQYISPINTPFLQGRITISN